VPPEGRSGASGPLWFDGGMPAPAPPPPRLVLADRPVDLSRTLVMGVVNATPDSFSDAGLYPSAEARVDRASELVAQGADVIDVGGESGITGVPPVAAGEEIARVVPVIEGIVARHPDVVVSIDTYKPAVADAALAAGARLVNDISGLRDPDLAGVAAAHRAGIVLMHNRARPKERLNETIRYDDVVADVRGFLDRKVAVALDRGVARDAIVVDPGPDFSKSPHQTVTLLRHLDRCVPPGFPILLAISRKDFIGALTATAPDDRLEGTLAAVGSVAAPGTIVRVHDVGAVRRYLAVHDALAGLVEVPEDLHLDPALRRTPTSQAANPPRP